MTSADYKKNYLRYTECKLQSFKWDPCSFCLICLEDFWVMVCCCLYSSWGACVCVWWQSLPLIVCLLLEVGGLSWCHWVQQAEPERGPLLAAVARVVPVPQKHTLKGDRREEWHRSDCPTAHSTDTSTGLAGFWTKTAFLDSCCVLRKWS